MIWEAAIVIPLGVGGIAYAIAVLASGKVPDQPPRPLPPKRRS